MREEESVAADLVSALLAAGIDASARGNGVHWHVEVAAVGSRSLVIHTFWYDPGPSGLMLGVNPANARTRAKPTPLMPGAAEYLTILRDDRARIADGRTRSPADVVVCAKAWLEGHGLEELAREVPFVDRKARAMREIAAQLDSRLRRDIGSEPASELWVYGRGRSCKIVAGEAGAECSFLIGQAQVANAAALQTVPSAVASWLLDEIPVGALRERVVGTELEPHAEVLETDPGRWAWLHLRDRLADPNDVLLPLRGLIEALARSPVVTRFFTFSSLNRLCFSASSHFPWVDEGLPIVTPASTGSFFLNQAGSDLTLQRDLGDAVGWIESTLAAAATAPFFGSAPHHELKMLTQYLKDRGSTLEPRVVQRGAWDRLEIAGTSTGRRCRVSNASVTFEGDGTESGAGWPTFTEAAEAARVYCEGLKTSAELLGSATARGAWSSKQP